MRSASGLQILSLVSCALDYKFLFCYTSLIVASCIGYFGFFAALFYPVRRPFYNGLFIPFNVFLCNWWVEICTSHCIVQGLSNCSFTNKHIFIELNALAHEVEPFFTQKEPLLLPFEH